CSMTRVKSYLSLIKFSHTIFAMPFALIGFFLGLMYANTYVPIKQWNLKGGIAWRDANAGGIGNTAEIASWEAILVKFLLVIGCMVFARSAAMSFNRYLDRSFDARNPRTAIREIPSGILKANNVLLFT